jgi:hypothetical protein
MEAQHQHQPVVSSAPVLKEICPLCSQLYDKVAEQTCVLCEGVACHACADYNDDEDGPVCYACG